MSYLRRRCGATALPKQVVTVKFSRPKFDSISNRTKISDCTSECGWRGRAGHTCGLHSDVDRVFSRMWYAVTTKCYLWAAAEKNQARSSTQSEAGSASLFFVLSVLLLPCQPDVSQQHASAAAAHLMTTRAHFLLRKNRNVLAKVWSCAGMSHVQQSAVGSSPDMNMQDVGDCKHTSSWIAKVVPL